MSLEEALAATWPPERTERWGSVTLRYAPGAGMRAQAATLDGPLAPQDLRDAEDDMQAEGRARLFRVRDGQDDFDAWLARRGYAKKSPTRFMTIPAAALAQPPRPISLFALWPLLAIQAQLWADAGQGAPRLAVMARAQGPKAAFLARVDNRAAGVAFAAIHQGTAMVHALWVVPAGRRRGTARLMMSGIAHWASQQGADTLALAVEADNTPARTLSAALGLTEAGGYHYREYPG